MLIANPLYDVVFKYLLDDLDIARELLSLMLGEQIVELEVKPQETAVETAGPTVSILRFDFKAIVKTKEGSLKKILIELQKAKKAFDVMRFRRYLGENYRKPDEVVNEKGVREKRPLPIVSIYFLGFSLENVSNALIQVNREYRDAITRELIDKREPFIELLTHDSFIVQLRKLTGQPRSRLERVLQVFSPVYQTNDPHQLDFRGELNEPLVQKMVDRLGRAIADEEMRERMDVEDEIYGIFDRMTSEKDDIIEQERQRAEAESRRAEEEKRRAEEAEKRAKEEKQRAEKEKQKNEALLREIEALKRKLKE